MLGVIECGPSEKGICDQRRGAGSPAVAGPGVGFMGVVWIVEGDIQLDDNRYSRNKKVY
jgi:hypothetical protein